MQSQVINHWQFGVTNRLRRLEEEPWAADLARAAVQISDGLAVSKQEPLGGQSTLNAAAFSTDIPGSAVGESRD